MGLPNLSVSILELSAIRGQAIEKLHRLSGGVGAVANPIFIVQG
jgi:hypothetical protein